MKREEFSQRYKEREGRKGHALLCDLCALAPLRENLCVLVYGFIAVLAWRIVDF